MGPMPKALVAVGSLLAAGMSVAPAQAATAAPGTVVVKQCSTNAAGVPLRVKMRFDMRSASDPNDVRLLRVRVSHPDGTGNFKSSRVRSVATTLLFESQASDPRLGSAAFAERRGDKAAYRTQLNQDLSTATAIVTFRLANGQRVPASCTQKFPG